LDIQFLRILQERTNVWFEISDLIHPARQAEDWAIAAALHVRHHYPDFILAHAFACLMMTEQPEYPLVVTNTEGPRVSVSRIIILYGDTLNPLKVFLSFLMLTFLLFLALISSLSGHRKFPGERSSISLFQILQNEEEPAQTALSASS